MGSIAFAVLPILFLKLFFFAPLFLFTEKKKRQKKKN